MNPVTQKQGNLGITMKSLHNDQELAVKNLKKKDVLNNIYMHIKEYIYQQKGALVGKETR